MSDRCQKQPGFVDLPCLSQARTAQTLRPLKPRAQPQGFRRALGGFRISPGRVVSDCDSAEEKCHLGIQGAEPDGIIPVLDRLAILPRESQAAAEMRVGRRGIWIEIDRPAERGDRLFGQLNQPFRIL